MVDLVDIDGGELVHPPSTAVQTRAQNHHLWVGPRPHGVVDRDGARHHGLGIVEKQLKTDPVPLAGGWRAGSSTFNLRAFLLTEQGDRDRIREPTDRDATVRDRTGLTYQYCRTTGLVFSHHNSMADVPEDFQSVAYNLIQKSCGCPVTIQWSTRKLCEHASTKVVAGGRVRMTGVVAQVGFGYWGRNIARTLNARIGTRLRYLVDNSAERRATASGLYPLVNVTDDLDVALADPDVDAVVIATPPATHAVLVRRTLAAGKNVLTEKPIAVSLAEAAELVRTAEAAGLVLMVGHISEFVPAVRTMKELISTGAIGDVLYLHSQRLDLGRVFDDVDVFWDLGPHDVSIANYLLDDDPEWVSAHGTQYVHAGLDDVVFATASYPGGVLAHMHVSRLDPLKTRRTTVVGSRRMIVYDAMNADAHLRVFDKGVDRFDLEAFSGSQYRPRDGVTYVPVLPKGEPLALEIQHFLDCVATGVRPQTDGWNAVRVLTVVDAVTTSCRTGGAEVKVVLPANLECLP
jgi:predicted dehydrogenase